jgi:hypothetical protein
MMTIPGSPRAWGRRSPGCAAPAMSRAGKRGRKGCPRERECDVRGAKEGDRFRATEIPFSRQPWRIVRAGISRGRPQPTFSHRAPRSLRTCLRRGDDMRAPASWACASIRRRSSFDSMGPPPRGRTGRPPASRTITSRAPFTLPAKLTRTPDGIGSQARRVARPRTAISRTHRSAGGSRSAAMARSWRSTVFARPSRTTAVRTIVEEYGR